MRMGIVEIVTFLVIIASSAAVAENVYGRKGSSYTFVCPHRKTGTDNVVWQFINKSGEDIAVSDETYITPTNPAKDRVEIVGDHSNGEYNLKLSDLRETDEGTYKCAVSAQQKEYYLELLAAPSELILHNVKDNKIMGTEGQSLTISCTATGGKPEPDLRLEVDSQVVAGKQSVQHTIPVLQRNHDKQLVKCQATSDALVSPVETGATLYLYLKPSPPVFNQDPPRTNDTQNLVVSCTSIGSRPAGAVIYWKVKSTQVTAGVVQQKTSDPSTDTYIVVSTLTYSVDRSDNGQPITCGVTHQTLSQAVEATQTISVYYAPDVTVSNKTHTQTDTTRTLQCTADGNPTEYTYYKWQHKSLYGVLIREPDGEQNGILTLPSTAESDRYQDSGEYICTVGNGIGDRDGKIKQTGYGYLTVNAQLVYTLDNNDKSTQYGEFGKSTNIQVYVYSVPKYTQVTWYKGNAALQKNVKYDMTENLASVKGSFHNVAVQLDGYEVTLTISNLVEGDFTIYELRLSNGYDQTVHSVVLESASAPQTPSNFSVTYSSASSISFEWDPGFNGGHDQTFHVEYRVTGTTSWSAKEIPTKQQTGRQTYILSGLEESTSYDVRMYAENKFNKSLSTDIESILTVKGSQTSTGAIIGGVAGGLFALIVVIILVVFFLRKRDNSKRSKIPRSTVSTDSEVEDGLQDNILYDGNGLNDNILYKSADRPLGSNSEYAEVEKKPAKASTSNSDYAEVQKPNAVYAEVDRKAQQKNAKAKKQKGKKASPKKQKDKALNNNPGDVYANAKLPMENMEGSEYANAEPRKEATNQNKNPQGLEYADLTFVMGQQKNNKPLIHGEDDRTIYSDVDHTKKAPPPPPESEYEETNIRHGKA